MYNQEYNVIGVMSGTSLDGIDIAQIRFKVQNNKWQFEINNCQTIPYSSVWVTKLKDALHYNATELSEINQQYTQYLGSVIYDFIKRNNIHDIDAVCSHGHTILHQPQNGITLQIGNLPRIAEITKQTVVCDFRVADVRLGGQGAPLVPIGDEVLFQEYQYCLNLGGFSNISFQQNNTRLAFDISAVNTVLNYYANQLEVDFDDKGRIAASGKTYLKLLYQLNALEYYQKSAPKSLGIEYVKKVLLPLIDDFNISIADKLNTFCEHIAIQISNALPIKSGKMLITGGGAYHDFLISRIKQHAQRLDIVIPDKNLLEYKEALIFGFLGVLRLRNEINVLSSVTGASKNHSSGEIFVPK